MILCCYNILLEEDEATLEIISNIATIIIALANTFLVWFIFVKTKSQSNSDKEQARKLDLLKSLILDHNLKHFYNFFETIENVLDNLKKLNLTDDEKSIIIDKGNDEFILLRKKFTDTLLAIDQNLYDNVLNCTDKLQMDINNNVFYPGNNLNHIPKYEECITTPLLVTRTNILKTLFQYKGQA